MRLALIDGDVLLYQNGFASDAAAKKEYEKENGTLEGFDIQIHHEPLEYCLHMVNKTIDGILEITESDEKLIYISHLVNYREQFYPPYKINRDINHKPYWYNEIKEFLLDRHGALFSEQGDEADDALGLHQCRSKEETIICSIDKDLDMIPGLHYNFSKTRKANGVYEMQDPEALRCFYRQMITGDDSDNIPGLYKVMGRKATAKVLAGLDYETTEEGMLGYVSSLFYNDMKHIAMVGKLLWIKRENKWWEPTL